MGYNDGKPFGVDISSNQGKINFDLLALHPYQIDFIAIRAGISWGYTDKYFDLNWEGSRRVCDIRTAYHVLYPKEDIPKQMEKFLKTVGDGNDLPLVEDIELDHGCPPSQIQDATFASLEYLERRTGRKPIAYSRATWIDWYLTGQGNTPPSDLNNWDWWLAQYTTDKVSLFSKFTKEHAGPVWLPKGVDRSRCVCHQTGDHTQGKKYGTESEQLDYDRWQFSLEHLRKYAGKDQVITPDPPVIDPGNPPDHELTKEEIVFNLLQQGRETFKEIQEWLDKG